MNSSQNREVVNSKLVKDLLNDVENGHFIEMSYPHISIFMSSNVSILLSTKCQLDDGSLCSQESNSIFQILNLFWIAIIGVMKATGNSIAGILVATTVAIPQEISISISSVILSIINSSHLCICAAKSNVENLGPRAIHSAYRQG